MAVRVLSCARRAVTLLTRRPISQAVGGRQLPTAVLALNLAPEVAEILEPLLPKDTSIALRLGLILKTAEQDKARAEQDKARAKQDKARAEAMSKQDMAIYCANIENVSKELDIAKQARIFTDEHVLKKTTQLDAWRIQEALEYMLGVEPNSRRADWDKVLQNYAHHDLVYSILTECLKTPLPPFSSTWKPTPTQLEDVAQLIVRCHGYYISDKIHHTVHKNEAGHLVIDTTQEHMGVAYQLGVKLSKLEPDIYVVKAPWLEANHGTEQNETCT